mmetsp:Transcript_21883/g.30441  ORF Transcript_21883/g.30441 Transcript_21883/m.30441 type:complete len:143 (+) Transcript_21883:393-821(+)
MSTPLIEEQSKSESECKSEHAAIQSSHVNAVEPCSHSALTREFQSLVDSSRVSELRRTQNSILNNIKSSRGKLSEFNEMSERSHAQLAADVSKHVKVVKGMQNDLSFIFKHTRQLRDRIRGKYPDAFHNIPDMIPNEENSET